MSIPAMGDEPCAEARLFGVESVARGLQFWGNEFWDATPDGQAVCRFLRPGSPVETGAVFFRTRRLQSVRVWTNGSARALEAEVVMVALGLGLGPVRAATPELVVFERGRVQLRNDVVRAVWVQHGAGAFVPGRVALVAAYSGLGVLRQRHLEQRAGKDVEVFTFARGELLCLKERLVCSPDTQRRFYPGGIIMLWPKDTLASITLRLMSAFPATYAGCDFPTLLGGLSRLNRLGRPLALVPGAALALPSREEVEALAPTQARAQAA